MKNKIEDNCGIKLFFQKKIRTQTFNKNRVLEELRSLENENLLNKKVRCF